MPLSSRTRPSSPKSPRARAREPGNGEDCQSGTDPGIRWVAGLVGRNKALAVDRMGDTAAENSAREQAVKIDPTLALAQNQLGYLASQTGDSSSAERHFRLAVEAAPEYTDPRVNLAATLGMEDRFPNALQAVDKALQLDAHNTSAQQLRQALTTASKTQH